MICRIRSCTPQIPDDPIRPCEPPDDQAEQVGVVQPRLDDVRTVRPNKLPKMPPAGQSLGRPSHVEGVNGDATPLYRLANGTRSIERDDGRLKPAPVHSFHQPQQHDFRAAGFEIGDQMKAPEWRTSRRGLRRPLSVE
jgi:hypothetical protein